MAPIERARDDQPDGKLRDDFEALRDALPELIKLERYERRAISRRRRAIRTLVKLRDRV